MALADHAVERAAVNACLAVLVEREAAAVGVESIGLAVASAAVMPNLEMQTTAAAAVVAQEVESFDLAATEH